MVDKLHTGPVRVIPCGQPWLLHDVAASRTIEAQAQATREPGALMRRAGMSVARLGAALAAHAQRIWVLAGPGGNGGDGLHAAAQWAINGRAVIVSLLADAGRLPADAAEGLRRAADAGVQIGTTLSDPGAGLVVDALLGLGQTRAAEGPMAEAIDAINRCSAPCLAVDLPSGLAARTGQRLGESTVHADATLSLLTLKPGMFTAHGRACCGEIWFDSLGVDAARPGSPPAAARLTWPGDDRLGRAARPHDSHKGSFGDVLIIGGAPGMVGAARLAAWAAQAAGAGRTLLSLLDEAAPLQDAVRPEWLWTRRAWASPQRLAQATVVCGCGGGKLVGAALGAVLQHAPRLVLDADALNAVASDPRTQAALAQRQSRAQATVLTPHPLEAARLLACSVHDVQADRLRAAQMIAQALQCVVVLKGSGTVVAAPGQLTAVNSTGNASLAAAGSGDVLAGWIAGTWAGLAGHGTGVEPSADQAAWMSAVGGAWWHGRAADLRPECCGRAVELVEAMRAARQD